MSSPINFQTLNDLMPQLITTFLYFALMSFFCYISVTYISILNKSFTSNSKIKSNHILLVIAHPDDECMFFGPALTNLMKYNKISILSLTSGNFYKMGFLRKEELVKSAEVFGIQSDSVNIIDNKEIPDGSDFDWDREVVSNEIINIVNKTTPDIILTFDYYGVSGHRNHGELFYCLQSILGDSRKREMLKSIPEAYSLESITIWRKYILIFDILYTLLSYNQHKLLFISSMNQVLLTQKAMNCHWSQLMWFRRLYVIFSRYMFINTFIPINSA